MINHSLRTAKERLQPIASISPVRHPAGAVSRRCLSAVTVTCARGMQACLTTFCEEEVMSAEEGWNCCRCHRMGVTATKQLSVSRLPSVLVVHLVRFDARGNKVSFIVQLRSSTVHLCCSVMPMLSSCYLMVLQLLFSRSCHLMVHEHAVWKLDCALQCKLVRSQCRM